MAGAIKPAVLGARDWQVLSQQHGGVANQIAAGGGSASNPLLAASGPSKYVIQFNDGTSITIHADIPSGKDAGKDASIVVDDWGTLGDVLDAQATQQATKTLTPEEQRIQQQTIESNDLSIQKQRQQLTQTQDPQRSAAAQTYQDQVQLIQQEIASGRMTTAEANKAIAQARQAFLSGGSQADWQQINNQRASTGAGLLNQRVSSGSSVLNQLLDGASSAFGKMLPGPQSTAALQFNPYRLASRFVTELGGGQPTYDIAQQMLQGAMQGPGADPTSPGFWTGTPDNPGDPGIDPSLDDGGGSSPLAASALSSFDPTSGSFYR